MSRTDTECQWKKQKPVDDAPKSAEQLFPRVKDYSSLSCEPNDTDREWLYKELSGYGRFTGMWWLMSPEPVVTRTQNIPVPRIEDFVVTEEFLQKSSDEQLKFFKQKLQVTNENIIKVADISKGQRTNEACRSRMT